MHTKPLFLFLSLCILLAACENKKPIASRPQAPKAKFDPDSAVLFHTLDTNEIFRRLFDNPIMQGKTAVWNPDYYEKLSLRLSYDDSCHTTIDTILYFNDRDDRKCAVVVFVTYRYQADSTDGLKISIGDCHFCGATLGAALFSQKPGKQWELYKFEKSFATSGLFGGSGVGGIGQLSLLTIGDSWTGLLLKQPIGGNSGQLEASASLYPLEEYDLSNFPNRPLSQILSYMYYTAEDEGPGVAKEKKTELETVEKKKQYYLIRLVTTAQGKTKTRYYRYSAEYNCYMPTEKR